MTATENYLMSTPDCKAEDVVRQGIPCQPSEGKYDGKPQNYCKRCGKKV